MAQQKLNHPEILGFLVYQVRFCSSHGMCAVKRSFETKLFNPPMKNSAVLSGWYVPVSSDPRPKQEVFTVQIAKHLSMQQQLLLSLWLSQIAQGYRFSVAAPLLCLKPSYHIQHNITSRITRSQPPSLLSKAILNRAKSPVLPSSSSRIRLPQIWDIWSGLS